MVHIHGIWNKYIPWKDLSAYWLQITGDSFVVRPERIKSKGDAVRYLFKYLTKNVVSQDQTGQKTLFNLNILNSAALFYESGKRRYQASRNFFPKGSEKKTSEYLPYYHDNADDNEIEKTIKFLKSEFELKREHFDLDLYPCAVFVEYLFNDTS